MAHAQGNGEPIDIHADWMSSADSFRLLVSSVRDYAIYMLDPRGYIRSWNLGAERAKGYKADEIIGKHFSIFFTPEDLKDGLPDRAMKVAAREGRFEHEGWRLRKDGTRFWADAILTAIYGEGGQVLGFAKVTRDMTEKRDLMIARDEAMRASQAKSAFLANMSHELRTPLNAILGYSEMVLEELRERQLEQLAEDVDKIRYSGQHLLSIVSDVLDLSRIEAGRLDLRMEVVHVDKIVSEVVETGKPLALKNENRTTVEIDRDCRFALADKIRLRQVVYNIYANACKFTRHGEIQVRVGRERAVGECDHVAIAISDTGPGMTSDQQRRVFDRFYQVESQTPGPESSSGGTGLGLAISKLICDALGAELKVSSEVGVGSTFTVLLPVGKAV